MFSTVGYCRLISLSIEFLPIWFKLYAPFLFRRTYNYFSVRSLKVGFLSFENTCCCSSFHCGEFYTQTSDSYMETLSLSWFYFFLPSPSGFNTLHYRFIRSIFYWLYEFFRLDYFLKFGSYDFIRDNYSPISGDLFVLFFLWSSVNTLSLTIAFASMILFRINC